MEHVFKKNLQALYEVDPQLAKKLENISTLSRFEAVQVGENPTDIDIFDHRSGRFIYRQNPRQALGELFEYMQRHIKQRYLYIVGIGNGFFLQSQLINHQAKRIYVFEAELEILYIALHLVDFAAFLLNYRLVLYYIEDFNFQSALNLFHFHEDMGPFYYHYSMTLILQPYYTNDDPRVKHVDTLLRNAIFYHASTQNAPFEDTLKGIRQTIANIGHVCRSQPLRSLLGIAPSEYAVIVATGPSLDKQIPLLKSIQNYATIVSVDASLPILEKNGITPHFAVSLERDEPTAKFFQETSQKFQKNIRFVLSSLQHKLVFESIKGGVVYTTFRPTLKELALEDYGIIGYGTSAANMALEFIIFYLQNKKIVFIGQDLAYGEDFKTHSSGHIITHKPGLQKVFQEQEFFEVGAYGGKGTVKTNRFWKMFKEGIEGFTLATNHSYEFINATEGGARIQGTKEIPFAKVCRNILKKKKKVKITPHPVTIPPQTCHNRFNENVRRLHVYGSTLDKKIHQALMQYTSPDQKNVTALLQLFQEITVESFESNFYNRLLFSLTSFNLQVFQTYNLLVQDQTQPNFYENAFRVLIDFFTEYVSLLRKMTDELRQGL